MFRKFCSTTTLHGLKIPFLARRSILEKILWFSSLSTLFVYLILTISFRTWELFKKDQIISILESVNYDISQTRFPAVTVCSCNVISKSNVHNFASKLRSNYPPERLHSLLHYVSHLNTFTQDLESLIETYRLLEKLLDDNDMNIEDVYKELAPDCSKLMETCLWKRKMVNCSDLFKLVPTSIGYCCMFNFHGFRKAIDNFENVSSVPMREVSFGYGSGLQLKLKNDEDDYFASAYYTIGYRVLIHSPYDYPDFTSETIFLGMGEMSLIRINLNTIKASSDVVKLLPDIRGCYFKDEKTVNNLYYSYSNCMIQCRLKLIHKMCACVPFFYRNLITDSKNLKVCTFGHYKCLYKFFGLFFSSKPGENETHHSSNISSISDNEACECWPECENTWYDVTISTTPYYERDPDKILEPSNYTFFSLFYSNLSGRKGIIKYKRFTEFLSLTAGLICFCTGFNLGCIFEILYHFFYQPLKKLFLNLTLSL